MFHHQKKLHFIQPLAIVPVYSPSGDSTALYLEDQVQTYDGPIQSFLDRWAAYYLINARAMTSYFRSQGISGPIPLYLGEEIYVSIKTRKAKVPGDRCYGYFAYGKIKDLTPEGLVLGPYAIPLACSKATTQKAINNGVLVEKIIRESPRFKS